MSAGSTPSESGPLESGLPESGLPKPEDLVAVARLHRPHGLRGEIRAERISPEVLDFAALVTQRKVWLRGKEGNFRGIRVLSLRTHQKTFLLTLEGIEERTAADALRGGELCILREDLPSLPEGWIWEKDLIGYEVEDATRGPIGAAAGLYAISDRHVLQVARADGTEIDIPWTKGLILSVESKTRKINVALPLDYPGLEG